MNDFDFIAVGDVVTDAFIKLKDATVDKDEQGRARLSMPFGDKIPYESVTIVPAVGNSPNAAVSAARLGLKTALISDIGDDENGQKILESLAGNQVATNFITEHPGKKSNYHYVLWYGDDRTILVKHEEYDRAWPPELKTKWLYLSSLGEDSLIYHNLLADYLDANPAVKLAFQPGTFQIKLGADKLARIYARTEIFFCNKDEAWRILGTKESDIKKLLNNLASLGPNIVVITDGPLGAAVKEGENYWYMPIYPDPKPPVNRTGAGDAYASTFTAALALGKSVAEALRLAPINSMSVVQKVGAQAGLLTLAELEHYLSLAPANYQPKEI